MLILLGTVELNEDLLHNAVDLQEMAGDWGEVFVSQYIKQMCDRAGAWGYPTIFQDKKNPEFK